MLEVRKFMGMREGTYARNYNDLRIQYIYMHVLNLIVEASLSIRQVVTFIYTL